MDRAAHVTHKSAEAYEAADDAMGARFVPTAMMFVTSRGGPKPRREPEYVRCRRPARMQGAGYGGFRAAPEILRRTDELTSSRGARNISEAMSNKVMP
jgi:hypothetical protein